MKFLVITLLIIVAIMFFRQRRRQNVSPKKTESIPMVPCAYCGVYISQEEALFSQGKTWCSQEHLQKGQ